MIRPALLLIVVVALMASARSFLGPGAAPSSDAGTALAFGFLVLAAVQSGEIAAAARFPRLTGYLLCGLACGPSAAGLLTAPMIAGLKLVSSVAVGLIALSAGCELDLKHLRPRLRSVTAVSALSLLLALGAVTALVVALGGWLPFLRDLTGPQRWVVAFNLGVLIASLSPSVVLALLTESNAQGPVSETGLGVVVLSDIAVIVLFGVGSSAAQQVFGGAHDGVSPVAKLAIELFGSVAVGALVAVAIRLWVRRVRRGLVLFILAVCVVAAEVGSRLHLDPLLINLAAGLILQNVLRVPGEEIAHALEPASLPIFAVFFALAGAGLDLAVVRTLWVAALVFALVRGVALSVGAAAGARLAGAEPVVQRWIAFALIPQAGVSVGLAELLARHFPTWGGGARALVLAVVTVNLIVGPVLLRLALLRSGEVGKKGVVVAAPGVSP
jgi:Kef-type K+ transport system membrane component KefB